MKEQLTLNGYERLLATFSDRPIVDQSLELIIERGKQIMDDASGWGPGKGEIIRLRRFNEQGFKPL